MSAVQINDVVKRYGALEVVHGINLSIQPQEFVVLVGPSGCGKSTTLRMLAGLEDISDGTVSMDGRVVNKIAPKDRDVAMVFQNYALYPHLSVADNIAFGLRVRGEKRAVIDKAVAEAAQILGLTEYLTRKPADLSGGQRQRVAMGRAVVRNPAVFLFDEPLSNLDAKLRVQMRSEIKTLHQKVGTTSIYVTHDQIEAMTLADRVVVLNHGRIEQQGTPLELYKTPANLFVAAFIGSPAMNLIEGVVDGEGDQPAARLKDGTAIRIAATRKVKRGQPVTIGLRPEHIGSTVGGDISLSGRTVLVEPTGAQTHVVFELAGDQVTAVVDGEQLVKVNTPFAATVHHERVHVFDRASGLAL